MFPIFGQKRGMADGSTASPAPTVTPTAPAAAANAGGRVLGRQDSTSSAVAAGSFDAWLAQKLKSEWSADELGALLTRERLADARASFPQLETPVKVPPSAFTEYLGASLTPRCACRRGCCCRS
jgi:hypothetical protein